jgi:hypothetical protein
MAAGDSVIEIQQRNQQEEKMTENKSTYNNNNELELWNNQIINRG